LRLDGIAVAVIQAPKLEALNQRATNSAIMNGLPL